MYWYWLVYKVTWFVALLGFIALAKAFMSYNICFVYSGPDFVTASILFRELIFGS